MNKVSLIGRLTADTELRYNANNVAYSRFTLAVNRRFAKEDGTREADFISCVAWKKAAELINKHFKKGSEIGLIGRIQTGSYEKEDGSKAYTTDVIIEEITFIGSKKEGRPEPEYAGPQEDANIQNELPQNITSNYEDVEIHLTDADLPF